MWVNVLYHDKCIGEYFIFVLAPNVYTENEQFAKYEIMDGAPVHGEFSVILMDVTKWWYMYVLMQVNQFLFDYFLLVMN